MPEGPGLPGPDRWEVTPQAQARNWGGVAGRSRPPPRVLGRVPAAPKAPQTPRRGRRGCAGWSLQVSEKGGEAPVAGSRPCVGRGPGPAMLGTLAGRGAGGGGV